MTKPRTTRRFAGIAATAAGLSVVASPAVAGANEISVDLGALADAAATAEVSEEEASNEDIINGLFSVAAAVEVNGSSLNEMTEAPPAEGAEQTVVDPHAAGLEGLGEETTGIEHELEALDLANGTASDEGQTTDGRTVIFPTKGRFTSGYGSRWGSVHEGIDIANSIGTPIRAAMDGTVIAAGPASGYGNWVVLEHANGEKSVYGHMANYHVAVGQAVTAGETIAEIGNEGRSTGPHLHFEIRPDGTNAVDPVPWFAEQGISVESARQ